MKGQRRISRITGGIFDLSGSETGLDTDPAQVRSDVECWLEFFGNYENGFVGDIPRLQRDYFTFMCWFYFSPLMCDLRKRGAPPEPLQLRSAHVRSAIRSEQLRKEQPDRNSYDLDVLLSENSRNSVLHSQQPAGIARFLQAFSGVFDDVTRERFSRHAPEIIKDEAIHYSEYPCFALSMNAEARSFLPRNRETLPYDLHEDISAWR